MITTEFGQRVRALRSAQGYTQETFSTACGLHRTYIAGVEAGNRNVTLETVEKIASTLNLPVKELFNFEAPMHTTMSVNIEGEQFLMETDCELTADAKDNIEIICRLAYDEDEPSLDSALQADGIENIYDASPFDIAIALQRVLKEQLNISAEFKAIDAEVKISE